MQARQSAAPFDDVRRETYESRRKIGFSPQSHWREAPATFDDHTLTIQGHPVMEDWEDSYMRELAAIAASAAGAVLEVGFGMGISARYVQEHRPSLHIVIEANRDVFEKLLQFAAAAKHPVQPIFGFWEDVTRELIGPGSLSGILFDTYPLRQEDVHRNHFPFFGEAHRMLKAGGVLTYYSDEINDYSPAHRAMLERAGFRTIGKKICQVAPPRGCAYWKSRQILAPIVVK